jgi:hypothetical protein
MSRNGIFGEIFKGGAILIQVLLKSVVCWQNNGTQFSGVRTDVSQQDNGTCISGNSEVLDPFTVTIKRN